MSEIIIQKEDWMNSPLSIARHFGGININGKRYGVAGREYDLVAFDYIPLYNIVSRDRFIELANEGITPGEAKEMVKKIKSDKKSKIKTLQTSLEL